MLTEAGKSRVLFYLRLGFGILLLLGLVEIADLESLWSTIVTAKRHLLALALLGILLNFLVMAYRWGCVLWVLDPDVSLRQLVSFYFLSGFLGNFLPTSLSADLLKIYCLARHTSDSGDAISSLVTDRVVGHFALSVIALIGFLAVRERVISEMGSAMSHGILAFLLLGIGLPLLLQSSTVVTVARKLLFDRLSRRRLVKKARGTFERLAVYHTQREVLAKVAGISFVNHIISILVLYVIALAFLAKTPIVYFFLFLPLASYLTLLPVSVGGIGVLEASLVFLFSRVGMPVEICVSMALAQRGLLILATVPGGVIYAIEGLPTKRRASREHEASTHRTARYRSR